MKKKIAILGSTSSIGKSLLNIIKKDKKKFNIELLTANTNYKDLINHFLVIYLCEKFPLIYQENLR